MIKVKIVKYLLLFFLIMVHITTLVLIQNTKILFIDETLHYNQILSLVRGDYSPNPYLLMFPGYHFVISIVARVFQTESFFFLRTVSFSLNLLLIFLFYRTAKQIDPKNAFLKTCLLAFLPVLFPYLFLLYTDGFSLFSLILTYYLVLNKRYFLSGITGTYSLFVRQNNLFIVLFVYFLIYIQSNGWKVSFRLIRKHIVANWIYLTGLTVFAICVIWTNNIMDNTFVKNNIAFSASSFANIYFSLFLSFWLFLPLHLANLRKIMPLLGKKLVIFLIFIVFCLFLISFIPDHPFNQATWFLHNKIFHYFSADLSRKILFFIPVMIAVLSLGVTKLGKKEYYWFYPFAVLYLLPLKMVEIRYSIIPMAFFILFMKKERGSGAVLTGLLSVGLSLYFLWGMLTAAFFP